MDLELNLRFVDVATQRNVSGVDGYSFADFFKDDGLSMAESAATADEATAILASTYKGADTEGVGVVWSPKQY